MLIPHGSGPQPSLPHGVTQEAFLYPPAQATAHGS